MFVFALYRVKVSSFAFGLFQPLLISSLGDALLGNGQGKSLYSFLSAAMSIGTTAAYLSFASLMEFSNMKVTCLYVFGGLVALSFLLFVLCFEPGAVYLACILAVLGKIAQRVVDVAFEALLDAVVNKNKESIPLMTSPNNDEGNRSPTDINSIFQADSNTISSPPTHSPCNSPSSSASQPRNAHQISSRSFITGYVGMLTFPLLIGPILYIFYLFLHLDTLWIEGILPLVGIGIWYGLFFLLSRSFLPWNLGAGLPLPRPPGTVALSFHVVSIH